MCVTICGRFRPDEGAVAGYGNRIRVKSPAKWGVQIAGMIFQTRSRLQCYYNKKTYFKYIKWYIFHLLYLIIFWKFMLLNPLKMKKAGVLNVIVGC